MEGTAAFQPFQALAALQQTACACPAPFNVPVQLTLGLTSLHQAGVPLKRIRISSKAAGLVCMMV